MDEKPLRGTSGFREKKRDTGQASVSGEVTARKNPVYPISAERELARVTVAYTDYVVKLTQPYVDSLMRQYEDRSYRQDSVGDFISAVREKISKAAEKISKRKRVRISVEIGVSRAGRLAEKHSIDDWNDQVNDALNTGINKEYYQDNLDEMVQNWIRQNVSKIQSIPSEYLTEVENIIRWGYETRQPKVNVYRKLEKYIGMSKSKAKMIARDQIGTLNSQMTRFEHESAGVSKYIWITKRDNRVRDSHRELHGAVQQWNAPPPEWYMTKSRGRVYTGRYAHPGESFGCRCHAKPVFESDSQKKLFEHKFKTLR